MRKTVILTAVCFSLTACSHTYYIVRHAEKAVPSTGVNMSTPNDPPLSDTGRKRAERLKEELNEKKIRHIYATNTIRAMSTAEPLSTSTGVKIQSYNPVPDSVFIEMLKTSRHNLLVVGHSNTVDDLVNGLAGKKHLKDLADTEYDNLFVITYKRFVGTRIKYERKKY